MLEVNDLQPTWVIEILYNIKAKDASEVKGALQGTIYELEADGL